MGHKIKKAQAAIWIILALFLIISIALFFLLWDRSVVDFIPKDTSPFSAESYLSSCVGLEVRRATSILLPQGGFLEPANYRLFNKTSVTYICETKSYFEPCINQHPMLVSEIEKEIFNFISPGVDSCINEMKHEVERRGGEVLMDPGPISMSVELEFDKVVVRINKGIEITEREMKRSFEGFVIETRSSVYNLAVIAQDIANQEALFCYFETAGFNLAYPRYQAVRRILSDQSKIYILTDKQTSEKMMIAVRSCALPEGMPG